MTYAGTTVPSGRIAGDGVGSYCLDRSQYCSKDLVRIRECFYSLKQAETTYPSQLSGHRPWIVQLSLGSSCPLCSNPVQVLQNCVCNTSPPGVGEQHVSAIAVVFSQEKTEGSLTQAVRFGKVLGTNGRCLQSGAVPAEMEGTIKSKWKRHPART